MNKKKNFLTVLIKISDILDKVIGFFACIFLLIVTLAVTSQVLFREMNIPVVWLGELSVYALIWMVFFGLAMAYKHNMLVKVDIICHIVPERFHKILSIIWDLCGLVLMLIILISSRDYITHIERRKLLSPELRWPLYIVYLGPVLGFIFTSFFTLVNIITAFWQGNKTTEETVVNTQ